MKKLGIKIIFTIILTLFSITKVNAAQFDVLVLPTDIFNVCDNYFCFPEPSEIAAKYVIDDLKTYKTINAIELADIRAKLESKPELKQVTQDMLKTLTKLKKLIFRY